MQEEEKESEKKSLRLDKKKRNKEEIIYHMRPRRTEVLQDRMVDDAKQMMCLN